MQPGEADMRARKPGNYPIYRHAPKPPAHWAPIICASCVRIPARTHAHVRGVKGKLDTCNMNLMSTLLTIVCTSRTG